MADNFENPDVSLPFSRPYLVEKLPANRVIKFDITPGDIENHALKAQLNLTGLIKVRFAGEIAPLGARGWQLDAKLGASVSQICIISAEPLRTRIDILVHIKFMPENQMPSETDETVLNDEMEPLEAIIDIGLVATEALTLEIPLYPRKEGAKLINTIAAPQGETPLTDAEVKPFAGLAALKQKLENKPD